jgi:hypothetical protein
MRGRGPGRWFLLGRHAIGLVVAAGGAFGPRVALAQGAVNYEVREQITGVILPSHDYGVTGTCATGTGIAPANVYAQGGSGRGQALGAGAGVRIGYEYAINPPDYDGLPWWGLRAQAGLDLNLLYANVDTGLADTSGKLCARLKADGTEVQYRGSPLLFAQVPIALGAEVGLGGVGEDAGWHGIVLGAAWVLAIGYTKPLVSSGDMSASYLGGELTLDFATLRASPVGRTGERVALLFLLPSQDRGPIVLTLSFGAVWH